MDKRLKYSFLGVACLGISGIFIFIGYQIFNTYPEYTNIALENNLSKVMSSPEEKEVQNDIYQERVNSDTRIVYEYHFKQDDRIERNYENLPYFLVGLTELEFKSRFNEWEITDFSADKVIMKKEVEEELINQYIIGIQDGFVAIFYESNVNSGQLKQLTHMPVSALAEEEQEKLRNGILIKGEEALIQALESYGS